VALHNVLELLIAVAAILAPLVTGAISARMRSDFAMFQLQLLKELNGRYVFRREWDELVRRLDNIERRIE